MEPLPANTHALVQSVSTIGLKYLSLERGNSTQTLKAGDTIPVSQTKEPVDLDQFFDMFDEKTRHANQVNLTTFGNGLAGRGIGLNETIATLKPLVTNAIPVLRNLASPQTGFGQLFIAFDRAAKEVAPVAQEQADLYSNLDTFFTAWASVAPSLEKTIAEGPATLHQATYSLPFQAEFVNKSADFMRLLRPSAKILTTVAAPLGHAFEVGAVNLRAATALNREVAEATQAIAEFAKNPVVTTGLEELHPNPDPRQPAVRRAGPGPDDLQLRHAHLPQHRQPALARASASARSAAPWACSRPTGPTTRAPPPPPTPMVPLSTTRPAPHPAPSGP